VLVPFLRFRLPALAYAGALFWASSRSHLPLPHLGLGFEDKIAHFCAYGILAYLVHRALTKPYPLTSSAILGAALLSAAYGLSDELHQRAVPGRTFDLQDLMADLAGIGLVLLLVWWRGKATSKTSNQKA
jgi:VanZ family protein